VTSVTPKSLWRGYKRLTQINFPPSFPIIQFPNPPLIIAFVASEIGKSIHSAGRTYCLAIVFVAMSIWAYEELAHGVNWFRRLLGAAYICIIVARIAVGLQR
jgi:hypothetical protein